MRNGFVRFVSLTIPVVLVALVWLGLAIQATPVAQIDIGAEGLARYVPRIEEGVLQWLIPDGLWALGHFTALPYTLLAWTILGSVALVIALRHRGEHWGLWSIIVCPCWLERPRRRMAYGRTSGWLAPLWQASQPSGC